MNDDQAFERATREWLEDGSDRTRAATIDAVLLAVRTTPQERDLRIPWRTAPMSNLARLVAMAVVAVLVLAVVAFNLRPTSGGVGGASTPSPAVSPSAPAPSPSTGPTPTPYSIDTTTWTTYTSARYGLSIGHPADWYVHTTATRDWTYPADAAVNMESTALETFVNGDSTIATAAWSVAVQPGTTLDTWLQAYCPLAESFASSDCATMSGRTVAASMDGHAGSLVRFTQDTQAFFLVNDRIYVVAIWQPEDFIPGGVSRLLEAYLSTMHLLPGGPAPSGTSPSPS
ncbi:MAG: hypothetical protein ACHQZR_02700 [Candidatus Limnocylindrales bacterium]